MSQFYEDPFFCVPRSVFSTSQGDVELPIFYYDSTAVAALFLCDRARVEALLPGNKFTPGLTIGKQAMVGLAFFEYRQTSIGAYNEVGLALPVLWRQARKPKFAWLEPVKDMFSRKMGYYVVDLPVTSNVALAAGREIWGYPKFVTPIDFSLQKTAFYSRVRDPEEGSDPGPDAAGIMTLAGKMGPGIPSPALSMVNYDHLNGQDLRTLIHARGPSTLRSKGSVTLRVGSGAHPMAAHLRELGLDGRQPTVLVVTPKFQSRLHQGAPLNP